MTGPVFEIEHLEKRFGENTVLRDINFSVNEGEVVSIIGASGSGKSTRLRCINLLEIPSGGVVRFHGRDILDGSVPLSQYRARVGMVFQQFNLFANMTVLENCVIGQMRVRKKSRADNENKKKENDIKTKNDDIISTKGDINNAKQ